MSEQPIPTLFHELSISETPFHWRGQTWIKVGQNHARLVDGTESDLEHVPSHERVTV